ncbi:hypothetical protein Aph01nite_52730 [Acrocarpospora phusangensis]|uniref:Uncharacterized protein n=1 Tax=Acrocarpospora phusangensis TaxID=1070424 RepID=A0A919QDY4_9ACTN|nr:hypothetical protein Aph01nite_52730 [Acrocarpospora phusangensis]
MGREAWATILDGALMREPTIMAGGSPELAPLGRDSPVITNSNTERITRTLRPSMGRDTYTRLTRQPVKPVKENKRRALTRSVARSASSAPPAHRAPTIRVVPSHTRCTVVPHKSLQELPGNRPRAAALR